MAVALGEHLADVAIFKLIQGQAVRQRSRLGLAAREELASAEEALLAARLDLLRDRAEILNAYHAFMSGILLDPVDQLYTAPSNER